jgi:parvulin-like peptidyl-prolyl isomerase|tara:strand:- start:699 stop:1970 length:1272 start_codon:yes stop_codon:yes gene_type:complete
LAKKKVEKPRREITKRQLSHWQQQKRRQRIVLAVGISIAAAVLVILGVGWYTNEYRPLHRTVIKVNDTEFDMNYYIKRLQLHGAGQTVLYLYGVVDDVETTIVQDELIRQGAMELGISVSDSETDVKLEGYDSSVSAVLRDAVRSQLLIIKLQDDYFESKVPFYAEQRQVRAMFLESESQAIEVRDRLKSGEEFAELAGELSLESFSQIEKGDLGWRPKDFLTELLGTSVPSEYAFGADVGVLSQPLYDEEGSKNLGYWLIRVTDRIEDPEQVYAHAILLGSEEQAWQVKDKIETGGDFAALAEEFSLHAESKESGGDLSWVTPFMMSEAFSDFAFDPDVTWGRLSEPIRDEDAVTPGGYWLVEVLDKDDNREVEPNDRELMKGEALTDWVATLMHDPENEVASYMDDELKRWAADRAYERLD